MIKYFENMKYYTIINTMSENSHVKWQNAGTKASNMYMKSDKKKESIS